MTNKMGWYDEKNREYVVELENDTWTPLPWSNLVANKNFGTLVTADGASFTWFLNSSLFRLTPWVNDPITREGGEKILFCDEATKEIWSPTPLPIREKTPYRISHGLGYTIFEHESHQIFQKVKIFVHPEKPLKFIEVSLLNQAKIAREISLTYSCQWVMGDFLSQTKRSLWIGTAAKKDTILAKVITDDFRTDYTAFLYGNSSNPLTIAPGQEITHLFILGVAKDKELTSTLNRVANIDAKKVFRDSQKFWKKMSNTIQIKTPDQDTNILINDRLIYQALVCRLWSRTGFYQPSGAFGFRDQLQDSLALVWSWPDLTREQILLAAGRQFPSGEVQQWWHPPENNGIISSSSDTHLWLVYATVKYWQITGDNEILDKEIPYLHDEATAKSTPKVGSLYEHCLVSIERTLERIGSHGLPLILSGDWNDSLNNVGPKHQGESIWLSLFLAFILENFASICELRKDIDRAENYRRAAREQAGLTEKHGWDGQWFARAFTDDGQILGTKNSPFFRIDSIVQSWSAICGLVKKDLANTAMESFERELVDKENRLVRILTPTLVGTTPYLGYVQEYPQGVRENGGFYCHAAIWAAWALATLGKGDDAMEIIDMINPLKRTATNQDIEKYMVEPYALASDIYTEPPYVGRGGWTWYTGSAATLYFVFVEEILGFKVRGDKFSINPCIPKTWGELSIRFQCKSASYKIKISNPKNLSTGVKEISFDGSKLASDSIPLLDDNHDHEVEIVMG